MTHNRIKIDNGGDAIKTWLIVTVSGGDFPEIGGIEMWRMVGGTEKLLDDDIVFDELSRDEQFAIHEALDIHDDAKRRRAELLRAHDALVASLVGAL